MAVIVENNTLRLYGNVLLNYGDDQFFTASDVARALSRIGEAADIRVHINSGGGDAMEGAAIHSLFLARKGRTNVVVEGLAASAASLIAMAGNTITMMPGSMMMIHDCQSYWGGNADAFRHLADSLDLMSNTYAKVYAEKTGKPTKACRDLMKVETWFSPETAVAEGFANRVGTGPAARAMAFDYASYLNAPPQLLELAKASGWKSNPVPKPKEFEMTEEIPCAKARVKAILQSKEADGRRDLAEHLAFDTDVTADAAVALLTKAPLPTATPTMSYSDRRIAAAAAVMPGGVNATAQAGRLTAAGLAQPAVHAGNPGSVDIVAAMQRRHPVKPR